MICIRRRFLATGAASFLGALLAPFNVHAARPERIYIQPLGGIAKRRVRLVQSALATLFGCDVRVLRRRRLPRSAWYKPRRRYRAEKLLAYLEKQLPRDGTRILGLTDRDISTTNGDIPDWGVLGLANLDATACVISSYRAKRRSRGRRHTDERLAKVAVHEIGHTLGLEHCPTVGCLMEDARGKVVTTDREYDICHKCRAELKRRGHRLPKAKMPWPKPAARKARRRRRGGARTSRPGRPRGSGSRR